MVSVALMRELDGMQRQGDIVIRPPYPALQQLNLDCPGGWTAASIYWIGVMDYSTISTVGAGDWPAGRRHDGFQSTDRKLPHLYEL